MLHIPTLMQRPDWQVSLCLGCIRWEAAFEQQQRAAERRRKGKGKGCGKAKAKAKGKAKGKKGEKGKAKGKKGNNFPDRAEDMEDWQEAAAILEERRRMSDDEWYEALRVYEEAYSPVNDYIEAKDEANVARPPPLSQEAPPLIAAAAAK